MKIVLATGGFDPLHSGHIDYLEAANQLGDELVVGVNSDKWLIRKKGRYFLPLSERIRIIVALKPVDHAIAFDDEDGTGRDAALRCLDFYEDMYPGDFVLIIANGGDRTVENTPKVVDDSRVEYRYGIGGQKTNSSSEILERWNKW